MAACRAALTTLLTHALAGLAPRPLRRSLRGSCSAACGQMRRMSAADDGSAAASRVGLPSFVMVDFDSTLTQGDTIARITELRESKCSTREEVDAYRSRLGTVVKQYLADRKAIDVDESAARDLGLLLREGEKAEHRSLDRVESALLLEGLTREELREAGSTTIALQDHVDHFLLEAARFGVPVYVCSANWSKDLIIGALEGFSAVKAVDSADLVYDARTGLSTGIIQRNIVSAFDKQTAFRRLKNEHQQGWSVYIGDGQPDCLGVVEADLGIVVGSSSSMRTALELMDEGLTVATGSSDDDAGLSLLMPEDSATIDLGEDALPWATINRLIFPAEKPFR